MALDKDVNIYDELFYSTVKTVTSQSSLNEINEVHHLLDQKFFNAFDILIVFLDAAEKIETLREAHKKAVEVIYTKGPMIL